MTWQGYAQILAYFVLLIALVKPLGAYMAKVFEREPTVIDELLGPVERFVYRVARVDPTAQDVVQRMSQERTATSASRPWVRLPMRRHGRGFR